MSMVSGHFTMEVLGDGQHVNMKLEPDIGDRAAFENWLTFAYCNDLVWRVHAMQSGGFLCWMSTIRMSLYRHLFRHIHGDQFMVPGAD
jgi:hypothetical protein